MTNATPKKNLLRIVFFFSLMVLLFLGAVAFDFRRDRADAMSYFGGRKTFIFQCTCTGNQLVYIQNAKGGSLALIYQAGASKLYSNNNIYGTYLLGSYSGGGQCEYLVGEDCVEMDSDGQMDSNPGTGTSAS